MSTKASNQPDGSPCMHFAPPLFSYDGELADADGPGHGPRNGMKDCVAINIMQIVKTPPSAKSLAFKGDSRVPEEDDDVAFVALAIGLAGSGTGAPLDSQ